MEYEKIYDVVVDNIVIGKVIKYKENWYCYHSSLDDVPFYNYEWFGMRQHFRTKRQAENQLIFDCMKYYEVLKKAFK